MQEPPDHALGRSRGGFGTKIHLVCDQPWFHRRHPLTAGQAHESQAFEPTMARRLFHHRRGQGRWPSGWRATRVTAISEFAAGVGGGGSEQSSRRRPNQPRDERFDKATYRRRHIIEQVVGWYKEYRALGTRHEKLAVNYVALWLVAIMDKALQRLFPEGEQ